MVTSVDFRIIDCVRVSVFVASGCFLVAQVYVVVGIAAVAFTGFLLMLVILKFGGNSKFGIKGELSFFIFNHQFPSCFKMMSSDYSKVDGFIDPSEKQH